MQIPPFHTRLMRSVAAVSVLLAVLAVGCAPLVLPFGASPAAPTSAYAAPSIAPSATGTLSAAASPSAEPFALDLTPLATETSLPNLVLPTEIGHPTGLQVWDGMPTYLAESRPEYYFRVSFDPGAWALTTDLYGNPVLARRDIASCVIVPVAGRGLPLNGTVDHELRRIGGVSFQISTAYINGVKQFVNYAGGDGAIFTSFEVSFKDQADLCLADAEAVLGTLTSVQITQATPIATP